MLLALALAYAIVEWAEAVGLWLEKRWAEYLTVLATTGFLPLEVHELVKRVTALRIEMGTSGPYLLGGHTAAGYWVDVDRRTSLPGLYAAGDVAGGAPKKYVSGAWVEARIAARTALAECARPEDPESSAWKDEMRRVLAPLRRGLLGRVGLSYEDQLRR